MMIHVPCTLHVIFGERFCVDAETGKFQVHFIHTTRGDQKVHGKQLPFLHQLINKAGITAHDTATHMQLIGYNMLDVCLLRALQLSSRQPYI